MNGENEPDRKIERQRTPPSELILFWDHVTRPNQGLSLSRSVGMGRREPWERGCHPSLHPMGCVPQNYFASLGFLCAGQRGNKINAGEELPVCSRMRVCHCVIGQHDWQVKFLARQVTILAGHYQLKPLF